MRLWDAATGTPLGEPFGYDDSVVAFSPDGTRLLSASINDPTARIWDASTGKPLGEPLEHENRILSGAFSPDGTRVLTGSEDNTARLWDAATGTPLAAPLRHDGDVVAVAFSRDGTRVLTASEDKTARLWDVEAPPLPVDPRTWFMLQISWEGNHDGPRGLSDAQVAADLRMVFERESYWPVALQYYSHRQELLAREELARRALAQHEWFGAAFHLRWLCRQFQTAEHWGQLGQACAELRRWPEAIAAYESAVDRDGRNANSCYDVALACLVARDEAAFWQAITRLVALAETSDKVGDADIAAWAATLSSSDLISWGKVVDLAKRGVTTKPDRWTYRESLGAAYFRSGDFLDAITELNVAIELRAKETANSRGKPTAPDGDSVTVIAPTRIGTYFSHGFLALALQKSDKLADAKEQRKILRQIAEKSPPGGWQERERRALLDAEILAIGGPLEPDAELK
jgi:tetratricopeptide (TPR) repeat protein